MLLEVGLQVLAGLTHIREVAGFTGQTVDPTFVVGWDVVAGGWFGELQWPCKKAETCSCFFTHCSYVISCVN